MYNKYVVIVTRKQSKKLNLQSIHMEEQKEAGTVVSQQDESSSSKEQDYAAVENMLAQLGISDTDDECIFCEFSSDDDDSSCGSGCGCPYHKSSDEESTDEAGDGAYGFTYMYAGQSDSDDESDDSDDESENSEDNEGRSDSDGSDDESPAKGFLPDMEEISGICVSTTDDEYVIVDSSAKVFATSLVLMQAFDNNRLHIEANVTSTELIEYLDFAENNDPSRLDDVEGAIHAALEFEDEINYFRMVFPTNATTDVEGSEMYAFIEEFQNLTTAVFTESNCCMFDELSDDMKSLTLEFINCEEDVLDVTHVLGKENDYIFICNVVDGTKSAYSTKHRSKLENLDIDIEEGTGRKYWYDGNHLIQCNGKDIHVVSMNIGSWDGNDENEDGDDRDVHDIEEDPDEHYTDDKYRVVAGQIFIHSSEPLEIVGVTNNGIRVRCEDRIYIIYYGHIWTHIHCSNHYDLTPSTHKNEYDEVVIIEILSPDEIHLDEFVIECEDKSPAELDVKEIDVPTDVSTPSEIESVDC